MSAVSMFGGFEMYADVLLTRLNEIEERKSAVELLRLSLEQAYDLGKDAAFYLPTGRA